MNRTFTKLGMIVAFMLSFLSASAYDFEVDGIYYTVTDLANLECKVVSGDSKYEGEVVIPSIVTYNSKTLTVVAIATEAFYDCSSLTSVTIPDSVTSIGNYAFYECSSLTSVTIPDSVTSIGGHTFARCSSLTSVTIGNSVTSIGEWAFAFCPSLTSINIPDSLTSIRGCTFQYCRSLTNMTIPNSVTSIGNKAFEECSSLTSVTIPDSVTSIGSSAFSGCSSLEEIKLSENLTVIDYETFYGCPKLESIIIPGSVKNLVQYYYSYNSKYYFTFTNLKIIFFNYSDDIIYSSYYSEVFGKNRYEWWHPNLTDTLEEVFFDRQMKYDMPLPNVQKLSFGEHLKEIQVENIQNCEKLDTIISYAMEPPTLPECSNRQYMNVVVKVPQEALEKYQQTGNWKNFWNLQGFDPSEAGIDEIQAASIEKVETGRFNLNGQRVGEDYQGIVIVRYSDGSARKLMAR